MEHWGNRLKRLRQQQGFTKQQDYAAACGVDRSIISNMEGGKYYNPRRSTLEKLAKPLDMTAEQLSAKLFDEGSYGKDMTLAEMLDMASAKSKEVASIQWFDVYDDTEEEEEMTGERVPYVVPEGVDPKSVRAYKCTGGNLPCLVLGGIALVDHAAYQGAELRHGDCVKYRASDGTAAAWVRRLGDTVTLVNNRGTLRVEDVEILGKVLHSINPVENPNV